ncbi:MAG: TMEM175 family protein [Solirubrobacterales bacterium]
MERDAAARPADQAGEAPGGPDGFDRTRALALSDGIFAFALTLLVLSISVPVLKDASNSDLAQALSDRSGELVSWLISFLVIGMFWIRHNAFMRRVVRVNGTFLGINLVFLALIAFFPYPTELLGQYGNAVALSFYAVVVALLIGANALVADYALTHGLTDDHESQRRRRQRLFDSLIPAAFFLASVPVAFTAGMTYVYLCWIAILPFGAVVDRLRGRQDA